MECWRKQVSLRCNVRYIAHILTTLEAGLHSPPGLYQWTAKPPMAPLDHIADIPVVGQEQSHQTLNPVTAELSTTIIWGETVTDFISVLYFVFVHLLPSKINI